MSLIDEYYAGRRPHLWEEWTAVVFTVPPKSTPTPKVELMTQEPIFGSLDNSYVDASRNTELVTLLSNGIVTVTFETSDGNIRTMPCTTKLDLIPEAKRGKVKSKGPTLQEVAFTPDLSTLPTTPVKPLDKNLFKVFAVDLQEWRSFRYERVKSFSKYN